MLSGEMLRRLLAALADETPAFRGPSPARTRPPWQRLISALADSSQSFQPTVNCDSYRGRPAQNAEGSVEPRGPVLFEVVHDAVREFAPEELPLLTALRRFDEAEVSRRFARGANRDSLGFGIGEAVAPVTLVVWTAMHDIADRTVDPATGSLFARVRVLLRKKLARKKQPAVPLPHLGRQELEAVRNRVMELAAHEGLSQARAQQVADGVVSRLVLDRADSDKA